MIKTIIFDLDDTLYPEKEFVESGFKAVAKYISKKYGIHYNKIFNILKKNFKQGLRKKNFDKLLKKINLNKERVQKLVKIYRNHNPKSISLYSNSEKILKELKNDFKICLITDGWKTSQDNKISALKIRKYFDEILISNNPEKNNWKQSGKPFKNILRKMKIKPTEVIYIGDNPLKDFIGPKKLGIFTVRIKRQNGEYNNIKVENKHKADFIILNLLVLKKIIRQINNEKN